MRDTPTLGVWFWVAAAVLLAQQGLDWAKVTLIHNGIYKLVITREHVTQGSDFSSSTREV